MTDKKNVVMDATILTSIMSCERLTDFRFNHNLVPIGGKGNSLEAGSLMHVMLEYYYKSIRDGFRAQARDSAIAAGESYIKTGDDGNGLQNTPKESTKHKNGQLKDIGWAYIIDTFQQYVEFYSNDSWIPLRVEEVLKKLLYEDDDIRLLWKGKVDLTVDTNQAILPVDHKTMRQNRDTLSLNNQFMGQCVLNGTRTIVINKIGYQSSLEPKDKFLRVALSYSADRLTEWIDTAAYYAKYLVALNENGYWPPRFSNCDKYFGCPFKDVCESDRNIREETLRQKFVVGEAWDISDDD